MTNPIDTRRKVYLTNGPYGPEVLVDSKPLDGLHRVQLDYRYGETARLAVTITLLGVTVDLEAAPNYLVKVIGPGPQKDSE